MSQSDYQRLRELLLRPEQQRLDELESLAVTPQQRLDEMEQVLPAALERAGDDGRLGPALSKPLKHGLDKAIREDASGLADVLFPIMGPSIRRAIAESLRDFIGSFNASVAQAVSWQGLRWRFEALRCGRSYGEVVLSHTLSYRVEQALLIHRDSGLVVSKAELSEVVANDSDAFSAMLSAIQDFVSDSLQGQSELSTLDMGERTIWIIRGPHAHLACIISGLPQPGLREFLADVLDEAHTSYGALLKDFSGDPSSVAGVDRFTQRCLGQPVKKDEQEPPRWPMLVLLLVLVALLAWLLGRDSLTVPERIELVLQDQPGVLLQSLQKRHGRWDLQLLRDPDAVSVSSLLADLGLDDSELQVRQHAYQSLDARLALPRLRRSLKMPDALNASLQDSRLILSGRATWAYIQRLEQAPWLPPGVDIIDTSAVELEYGLEPLKAALAEGVDVDVVDGQLQFRGTAKLGWIRDLKNWAARYSQIPLAQQQGLVPVEWRQMQTLVSELNGQSLYFAEIVNLAPGEQTKLGVLRDKLKRLDQLSQELEVAVRARLTAWSDGLGTQERNEQLRALRAAKIAENINPESRLKMSLQQRAHPEYLQAQVADLMLRRVDIEVQLAKPPEVWK